MYMRPNTLAPAPGAAASLQPLQPQPQLQPNAHHSQHRFYELLDALKLEYDLAAQASGGVPEMGNKMSINDYESKGRFQMFLDNQFKQFSHF